MGLSQPVDVALAEIERLLRGDPAQALRRAGEVLLRFPGNATALLYQAMAQRSTGAVESAASALRALAEAHPQWPVAHAELGFTLSEMGLHAEAGVALRRAVALQPGAAEAWRALGDALAAAGDQAGANTAYDNQLRAAIGQPLREATVPVDGKVPDGESVLRAHLMKFPTDPVAIRALAESAVRKGQFQYAEKLLARCLEYAPQLHEARFNYALVLYSLNQPAAALGQLQVLLAGEPMNLSYRNLQAVVLVSVGDLEQANTIFAGLLAAFPNRPKIWLSYGHALSAAGRLEESIAAYRQCTRLSPGFGEAYWSLANLKTFRFSAAELQAMRSELAGTALREEDRVHMEFALAKADEDAQDYAASFQHYLAGNRLRRAGIVYSATDTHLLVERSRRLYTQAFFSQRAGHGAAAPDPIFIVGLPRSGSTLIEQILASHSAVEGTAELPQITAFARLYTGMKSATDASRYPEPLANLSAAECRELSERYLQETRVQRHSARPFFIDKMPDNFLHVGLIQLILPNARIVDARRHPMACCFSGFKQLFARGELYSYSLEELGQYYRDYVELMAHIDQVLPGKVHRVHYEHMIGNTESEVRRLLDYCHLPFEESCLRFYENERAVRTASAHQVRQPIFRGSLDQWRHFEPWLGPLQQALGPALDAYPDFRS